MGYNVDSQRLKKMSGRCTYHFFFYVSEILISIIKNYRRTNNIRAHIFSFYTFFSFFFARKKFDVSQFTQNLQKYAKMNIENISIYPSTPLPLSRYTEFFFSKTKLVFVTPGGQVKSGE